MYNILGSIVLYNTDKEELTKAAESFLNSDIKNIKLCLIDNSEYKLTHALELAKKYPQKIDYIFNNANLGYGTANNIAIKKYQDKAKYHVFLNPDIYFDKDVLPTLFKELEQDKSIGLASTKILYNDKKQQFVHRRLPTPFDVGLRLIVKKIPFFSRHLIKIFKKSMDKYELRDLNHKKKFFCPFVSGCFMFFRNSLLKQLGGFDERFFMYFEDVDISRRAFEISENVIFNNIEVYHSWEKGSHTDKKRLKYHLVSTFRYFNKWGWFFDLKRRYLNKKM